jgi:Cyclic nucleotide-binding domain
LASRMKVMQLKRNQVLMQQGTPTKSFYLLENGEIRREFLDPGTGKRHTVEFLIKAKSINSMRVLSGDPTHSTVRCVAKDGCKLFEMQRETLLQTMREHPDMGIQMASALSEEVRLASKKYATPLLEQRQQEINVPAVMIAAGVESYYRSALNAQINRALTGVSSDMFPNMHIQVRNYCELVCVDGLAFVVSTLSFTKVLLPFFLVLYRSPFVSRTLRDSKD